MARELFTIGYEKIRLDELVSRLKEYAIECLIDVREIPLSRKPGFSKSHLEKRLTQENILYVHFKELGSPKVLRDELKLTRNYEAFFRKIDDYLTDNQEAIGKACSYLEEHTCCLMCFESLAEFCHRTVVARKIKEYDGNGLRIRNI